MQAHHKYIITFILSGIFCIPKIFAQNINGFVIHVGPDAPAFIVFKNEVKSFEFNLTDGYKFYDIIRRSGNAISIAYRRASAEEEPTRQSAVVMEGRRTHLLEIVFQPNYDINKNPQLLYDYSDLKELKKLIAQHKEQQHDKMVASINAGKEDEQAANENKEEEKEQEALREKQEQEAMAKINEEKERKAKEAAEKERLAKEAAERNRLAQQAKEAARKKAEQEAIAAKKEQERLAKEAAEKERKAKEAAEKERLAKAKEEAARKKAAQSANEEKAKKEQERLAKETAEKERLAKEAAENERLAKEQEAIAKRKAAEAEEKARLAAQIEAEEKARIAEEKKYSQIGLWERYGSKGINIFDIPPAQHQLNNADFFLSNDTLRNFQVAQKIIDTKKPPAYHIVSNKVNDVQMTLENIHFEGGNVYYELLVENKSKDDFLQGPIGMYWYLQDATPYKWLSCSYYTYIADYNIVKPGESDKVVFVTRLADVLKDDKLMLVLRDRRWPEEQQMSIQISGEDYNKELSKTDVDEGKKNFQNESKKPSKKKK